MARDAPNRVKTAPLSRLWSLSLVDLGCGPEALFGIGLCHIEGVKAEPWFWSRVVTCQTHGAQRETEREREREREREGGRERGERETGREGERVRET